MADRTHWFPARLTELDRAACLELLERSEAGRVAYCGTDGPVILPVNHVVVGGDIVFRTAAYTALARDIRRHRAAFQVDGFDADTRIGWSVLVRGPAEFLDAAELARLDLRPTPWVEGQRTLVVRIRPTEITGRRLVPA